MKLYMDDNYKGIIKRILKQAFGIGINFKTNVMTMPFNFIEGKFYPKVGTYNILTVQTTYEKDGAIMVFSVDEMTNALKGG